MFTQGLDNSALRWVREGSVHNNKEVPISTSNQRSRIGPILNSRSGSRGFGLPPPGKFLSGHLPPGAILLSGVAIPRDDHRSGLDNDITSEESESDVNGGRYSLDSSPQNAHARPSGSTYSCTNGRPLPRETNYASDYTYSDVNSSVEFSGKGVGDRVGRLGKLGSNVRRYPVAQNGYTEEESSGSAASSEFSSLQVGSGVTVFTLLRILKCMFQKVMLQVLARG